MKRQLCWTPSWSSRVVACSVVRSIASCGRQALWCLSCRTQTFKRRSFQRNSFTRRLTSKTSEVQVQTANHTSLSFEKLSTAFVGKREFHSIFQLRSHFYYRLNDVLSFWKLVSCFHFYFSFSAHPQAVFGFFPIFKSFVCEEVVHAARVNVKMSRGSRMLDVFMRRKWEVASLTRARLRPHCLSLMLSRMFLSSALHFSCLHLFCFDRSL